MKGGGLLLLFVVVCGCLGLFSGAEAQKEDVFFDYTKRNDEFLLKNGFVQAVVKLQTPSITSLSGDFLGEGRYGKNVLSGPGVIFETGNGGEIQDHNRNCILDSSNSSSSSSLSLSLPPGARVTRFANQKICLNIKGICGGESGERGHGGVFVTWSVCLMTGSRRLEVKIHTKTNPHTRSLPSYYGLSGYFSPPSITATLRPKGTIQQMNALHPLFVVPPSQSLYQLFSVGGGGAVGVRVEMQKGEENQLLVMNAPSDEPSSQYMPRGKGWWNQKGIASSGKKNFFNSGFMLLMSGTVTPVHENIPQSRWGAKKAKGEKRQVTTQWVEQIEPQSPASSSPSYLSISLTPNNYDFPITLPYIHSHPSSSSSSPSSHHSSASLPSTSASSSASIFGSSSSSLAEEDGPSSHLHLGERPINTRGPSSLLYSSSPSAHAAWQSIYDKGTGNLEQQLNDTRALFTAAYGTSLSTLKTQILPDAIAPTVSFNQMIDGWEWGYFPNSNFFDPDAYIGVSGIILTGDKVNQREARNVISFSLSSLSPEGQVPHHFDATKLPQTLQRKVQYEALSGARQPGPNFFTIMAALTYTKYSGDWNWLYCTQYSHIQEATKFILSKIDQKTNLISAPGPLMIDTLVREGLQSDTNIYLVHFLKELGEAVVWMSRFSENDGICAMATKEHERDQRRRWGEQLLDLRERVIESINQHLWKNDHYSTSPNEDMGDHDSNLMAIAFGVADKQKKDLIWGYLDKAKCLHSPSETYYGRGKTYGGNTGDSDVRLARIALMDAYARHSSNDGEGLKELADLIESELLDQVWMYERYSCPQDGKLKGKGEHSPYFFEWPSVLVLAKVNLLYGINLDFPRWSVSPTGIKKFSYLTPLFGVIYDEDVGSCVAGPGKPIEKDVLFSGFSPYSSFRVHGNKDDYIVESGRDGSVLLENVLVGKGLCLCVVKI